MIFLLLWLPSYAEPDRVAALQAMTAELPGVVVLDPIPLPYVWRRLDRVEPEQAKALLFRTSMGVVKMVRRDSWRLASVSKSTRLFDLRARMPAPPWCVYVFAVPGLGVEELKILGH